MPWGAAIAAVGGYLTSKSASKKQKDAAKDDAKFQKEMLEMKRKYELEDRAYRQQAAGNWAKFANPSFVPQTFQPGPVGADSGSSVIAEQGPPPPVPQSQVRQWNPWARYPSDREN